MLDKLFGGPSLSFRTRSPERDNERIGALVDQVGSTLERAAQEIEAQRDGLRRRLDSVITRAAVIGGNDIDDSITRDKIDAAVLAASDVEIGRAESRLRILEEQLSHFNYLKAALYSRLPTAKDALPVERRAVIREGS